MLDSDIYCLSTDGIISPLEIERVLLCRISTGFIRIKTPLKSKPAIHIGYYDLIKAINKLQPRHTDFTYVPSDEQYVLTKLTYGPDFLTMAYGRGTSSDMDLNFQFEYSIASYIIMLELHIFRLYFTNFIFTG